MSAAPAEPLARLLERLDGRGIRHVYWKPSRGLDAALADSRKDFDLLVDPARAAEAAETLGECGFVRFESRRPTPGWSHWLAREAALRRAHVHLHERLFTGRGGAHELELPWVEPMLAHRVARGPCYVLDPSLELLVAGARVAVEDKYCARVRGAVQASPAARELLREARAAAEPVAVARFTEVLFGPAAIEVRRLLGDGFPERVEAFRAMRRLVIERFADAPWVADVRLAGRLLAGYARARRGETPAPTGLRRPGRGVLVAVIGADGSGKSTVTAALAAELSEHLWVEHAYLGRGDWVGAARQRVAEAKWAVLERMGRSRPAGAPPATPDTVERIAADRAGGTNSRIRRAARDGSMLALARRKRSDLEAILEMRRAGALIITDRYPHPTERLCDGPGLLATPHDGPLRRLAGSVERRSLRGFAAHPPDLLIRLHVAPRVAVARKPDHSFEAIRAKAEAVARARYGAARSVDIDAGRPLEEVLAEARRAIWSML